MCWVLVFPLVTDFLLCLPCHFFLFHPEHSRRGERRRRPYERRDDDDWNRMDCIRITGRRPQQPQARTLCEDYTRLWICDEWGVGRTFARMNSSFYSLSPIRVNFRRSAAYYSFDAFVCIAIYPLIQPSSLPGFFYRIELKRISKSCHILHFIFDLLFFPSWHEAAIARCYDARFFNGRDAIWLFILLNSYAWGVPWILVAIFIFEPRSRSRIIIMWDFLPAATRGWKVNVYYEMFNTVSPNSFW